ncbi:MAG: zinc ribbon domain-containing protein [Acetatifactor sp.]|nr:zinc ribbon domain-containing protein [Acetatifactor sp.]
MNPGQLGTIIILVLILIVIGTVYVIYRRIRKKLRDFSSMAFGTPDLVQGLKSVEREAEITPKSVAAATSLYLPNIMRDFPEFHYDEMKKRAENVLVSFLRSVDGQNPELLAEGTSELRNKLKMKIDMLRQDGKEEHFRNIKIHRTEIRLYRRLKGRCSIILQSAVQYNYFVDKGGVRSEGSMERLKQSRYDVEMIYIQDRDVVENLEDAGLAMNCPNCGAPLPSLGAKKCAYCDSPIVEFSLRTWNFSDVKEA